MRLAVLLLLACGAKQEAASAPDKPRTVSPQAYPYLQRSHEAQSNGDWTEARKALQECVEAIGDPDCKSDLQELESRHRF